VVYKKLCFISEHDVAPGNLTKPASWLTVLRDGGHLAIDAIGLYGQDEN
jgi:hypothetical protein